MDTHHKVIHKPQPKVFYLSFTTAMFERFGYYIIGFLLTLYVKNVYGYTDAQAFTTFALFTAMGYLTPAIGGYLSDNFIGIKRCLGLGLLLEGVGYSLLAIPTDDITIFHIALSTIIIGAGLFKTAPTNILGRAYEKSDPRIDSGFTLYYMAINIGSLASSLISGTIYETLGWHYPFAFAALGLFIGVILFFILKHHAKDTESKAGKRNFSLFKWLFTIVALLISIAFVAFLMSDKTLADAGFYIGSFVVLCVIAYEITISSSEERRRIFVCLILILMAVIFFILYFQLYTSMELFIERNVHRTIFGWQMPTVFFLGLNGFWIIVLSPIFARVYRHLRSRGKGIAITIKFPMGILLIALCFLSLNIACRYFATPESKIHGYWMVIAIFLYSAGELLTSALGVAMITRIAPRRVYGIMMGAWYLIGTALAAELSGRIAGKLASIPKSLQGDLAASLHIYGSAFWKLTILGIATAIIGFIISPYLKKTAGVS